MLATFLNVSFSIVSSFVHRRLSLETEEDRGTEFITAASDLVSCIPMLLHSNVSCHNLMVYNVRNIPHLKILNSFFQSAVWFAL